MEHFFSGNSLSNGRGGSSRSSSFDPFKSISPACSVKGGARFALFERQSSLDALTNARNKPIVQYGRKGSFSVSLQHHQRPWMDSRPCQKQKESHTNGGEMPFIARETSNRIFSIYSLPDEIDKKNTNKTLVFDPATIALQNKSNCQRLQSVEEDTLPGDFVKDVEENMYN